MKLDKSNEKIGAMFNDIAPTYDKLNHLLSFNADKKWRKKAIDNLLQKNPSKILDIATGSGDMLLTIAKRGRFELTGMDISEKMMEVAKKKFNHKNPDYQVEYIIAPAENIPFNENSFDAASVAFGVRNFENLNKGLTEIRRVLKNNGIFVILEFVKPQFALMRVLLGIYLRFILPLIGSMISGNKIAYKYLVKSIGSFYKANEFEKIAKEAGFKKVRTRILFMGLVAIFVLEK